MNNKRRYDILLTGGILLAAAVLYLFFRPGDAGAWAVVSVDGKETARYALDQDIIVTLGDEDYNVLEISGGAAAITDANCGDHTCIHTGAVRREGEAIVCLPHRLIVQIEGGDAAVLDGMAG